MDQSGSKNENNRYHRLISGLILLGGLALVMLSFMTVQNDSESQDLQMPMSPASAARLDDWIVLGPGGGGAQFMPTASPHDSNRLLVSCDMTGSYVSHDAGESWRMFNLRGRARFFLFDPNEPDVIYVQTIGLWRSDDAGRSWNLVYPRPDQVRDVRMANDHASERIMTDSGPAPLVTALNIDPDNSRILFAAVQEGEQFSVQLSRDRGESWSEEVRLTSQGQLILIDPESPAQDRTIYVLGSRSVTRRAGGEWKELSSAPGAGQLHSVTGGTSSDGEVVFYGLTGPEDAGLWEQHRILVSRDGGGSWQDATSSVLPGSEFRFSAVAASLNNPEVAYLAGRNQETGERHLFRTSDRGQSWIDLGRRHEGPVNIDAGEPANPPWFYRLYSGVWNRQALSLGVDPNDPDICYASDFGNTLRSVDGGTTWKGLAFETLGEGRVRTRGLDVTTAYGVHINPFDPRHIFISYTDIGAFESRDEGRTWQIGTTGIPRDWRNTTYWIVFDPDVRGRMWGAFARNHDLPRPKMWRTLDPLDYQGGVAISTDTGETWTASSEGMPETAVTHLLLDPDSPPPNRTLYAAGFGTGVFKSTDGGRTWDLKNEGIEGDTPFAWRLARDNEGVLYLIVARRSEGEEFNTPEDGALYRSVNGAESWEKMPLPQGVNGPNGIAIDPDDPERLYLAAWSRPHNGNAVGGGIFLSADGGASWQQIFGGDQHVYDVTIDPTRPEILYACGFESSAWRSEDRGRSWQRIQGFNFKWGHRVIPDPRFPEHVFITTFGGSVWYGPARGDSEAPEDIATSALQYSQQHSR